MKSQKPSTLFLYLTALLFLAACPVMAQQTDRTQNLKQAGKSPIMVFILAGQSNMEGHSPSDSESSLAPGERTARSLTNRQWVEAQPGA